ncbi:hypothetical protein PPTG_12189 [Phytophthora nicotianae INRA-310]|uniref:Uncharacterized protein n=2 Tax=Phytophthora nicotianae TaxID=4792 RepID=W2Q5D2_PHYN3|nr:hypothetical protein PPTG_12189 [Phytophthora nicotianae INRA-310]ETN08388.1 hypothetical protein PPTG_12189 [Phytophthora nicotianae INRA-310]ETO75042.1 hypothetical protein F444_09315 [Phytophthora nicotianae P1976]
MALREIMIPGSRLVPLLEKLAVVTVAGGEGTSSWFSSLPARARRKSFRKITASSATPSATARMATIKTVFESSLPESVSLDEPPATPSPVRDADTEVGSVVVEGTDVSVVLDAALLLELVLLMIEKTLEQSTPNAQEPSTLT